MPERVIQVNGLNISLREEGQGTPFLVLHGWGSSKKAWIDVQDSLSKYFRVIVFDFPCFGQSDMVPKPWNVDNFVEFFDRLLKVLEINEPFYLAGHSFGGRVSIKFSAKYPERIKEMLLIDAAGIKHKKTLLARIANRIINKITKQITTFSFFPGYKLLRRIVYRVFFRKSDYLDLFGVKKETFVKVIAEDLSNVASNINVKTHIIWGKDDTITPLEDANVLNEKIKGSDLTIIPSGHMPYKTDPQLLAKTILEVLKI